MKTFPSAFHGSCSTLKVHRTRFVPYQTVDGGNNWKDFVFRHFPFVEQLLSLSSSGSACEPFIISRSHGGRSIMTSFPASEAYNFLGGNGRAWNVRPSRVRSGNGSLIFHKTNFRAVLGKITFWMINRRGAQGTPQHTRRLHSDSLGERESP